jgi:condensin complex subunit 3
VLLLFPFENLVEHAPTPAAEQKKNQPYEDDDEDTPASRFTNRILRFLLKGFVAKDKTVRYRVVHLVAEMVASLGEIEYVFLS